MKKLFTKIVGISLGIAMAIGVGVGIGTSNKEVARVDAATKANWQKVTGSLVAGTEYLIVSVGDDACMAPANSTSEGNTTTSTGDYSSVEFSNSSAPSNGFVFADAGNGKFYIKDGACFVYASGSTNNGLGSKASAGATDSVWNVTNSSGTYTLITDSSRQLSKYSTNWRVYATTSGSKTNVHIYEKAAVSNVTATYVSSHGTLSKTSDTVVAGSSIALPTISNKPSNYSFEGFSDGVNTYAEGASVVVNSNTTFTAQWTEIKELSSISLSGQNTAFNQGDSFTFDGTVTAHYADSSTSDVTSKATFSGYNMSLSGNQQVTVSYTEGAITKTTTYNILVSAIQTVTFVAGTDTSETNTLSKYGITLEYEVGHGTFSRNDNYRIYSGYGMTITSTIGNIDNIQLTFNGNSNGGWSTSYTEINATSKTLPNTSAQAQLTQVTVNLVTTESSVTLSESSIDLMTNNNNGVQVEATIKNIVNASYLWSTEDANITLENANTSIVTIKPNTLVDGGATVHLVVSGKNKTSLEDVAINDKYVSVTIIAPGPGESQGTAYNVSDAIAHIDAVIDGGIASGNDGNTYYATGIVSSIYSASVNGNGQISYYISSDGTTSGNQLEAYNGKGLNGEVFSSIDDVEVGDTVIICGQLKKYNSTYEFDSNNYLVSQIKAPRVNSISLTPTSINLEPGVGPANIVDLFTNITINQDDGSNKTVGDIVWTSDDDDVFYIDGVSYLAGSTHRSSTTIHASISGKEYASAVINIIDSSIPVIPYNNPIEWVAVADISTLAVGDQVILVGVKDEVTYAAGTYSSGNNVPADTEHTLTVSNNKVTGVASTMIYTLEEGSESGSVAFKDSAGKYLYAAGGTSNNYLKTKASIDGDASFVLNQDGTVVAQGDSTRNYMRYNNTSTSNLFACYGSSSSTGDLVTFYKRTGGSGIIDLTSASSTATLHGEELEPGVASSVSIRFGAKISITQWNAIEDVANVTDYGVLLFRTRKALSSDKPVQDAIDLGKTPTKISKGSGDVPSDPEDGYYSFTVTVNISSSSNYDIMFCAAPFIEVNGTIYILDEIQYSVKTLAEYYVDHSLPCELSEDALMALAF